MTEPTDAPSPTPPQAAPTPSPASPQPRRFTAYALAGVSAVALGAGVLLGGQWNRDAAANPDAAPRGADIAATPAADVTQNINPPAVLQSGAPVSLADLVQKVRPAVVSVSAEVETPANVTGFNFDNMPPEMREFFERFGGPNAPQQRRRGESQGSGFIIDAGGFIVTNNHVIENAKKITVNLDDGSEYEAKLIGRDPATDVALLKIEPGRELPYISFGDEAKVRVGDWVVAVGNPFGLGGTVTAGIVSSLGRDIAMGPYTDFIQIDAPINRGNSGGPTFSLTGEVIGMNTAIFSPTGGSVGIGFAIPASLVQKVVRDLRETGEVTRGWLGVQIQGIDKDIAASMGLPAEEGAIVGQVLPNSPAERAGFKVGDVVLSVNGDKVKDNRDLTRRVGALKVGDEARFRVWREGGELDINATIERRDDERLASTTPQDTPSESQPDSLGLGLSAITPQTRQQFDLEADATGVVVTMIAPDSEAADRGIRRGEVILSVGNQPVATPQEVAQRIQEARDAGRKSVLFLVGNRQGQRFVPLRLDRAAG